MDLSVNVMVDLVGCSFAAERPVMLMFSYQTRYRDLKKNLSTEAVHSPAGRWAESDCPFFFRLLHGVRGGRLRREDVRRPGHPACRDRGAAGRTRAGHQPAGQGAARTGQVTTRKWLFTKWTDCVHPYYTCVTCITVDIFERCSVIKRHETEYQFYTWKMITD